MRILESLHMWLDIKFRLHKDKHIWGKLAEVKPWDELPNYKKPTKSKSDNIGE